MSRPQMEEDTQVITKWLSRITTRNTKEFREGIYSFEREVKRQISFWKLKLLKVNEEGKGYQKIIFIYLPLL